MNFKKRRSALVSKLQEQNITGQIFLPGHEHSPINALANPYYFRQDSTFLYFFGINAPGYAGIIDPETGKSTLYGPEQTIDEVVWEGKEPTLEESNEKVRAEEVKNISDLRADLRNTKNQTHYLPPYRPSQFLLLSKLLEKEVPTAKDGASLPLIHAVISLREIKEPEEIREMEKAMAITREIHLRIQQMAQSGNSEREIMGEAIGIARAKGAGLAYSPIISTHGEILHNHHYDHVLKDGDLLLCDVGAESLMSYASDITRTFPVGGRLNAHQQEVYEIVSDAQQKAIDALRPGITFRKIHNLTAVAIAEGLCQIGLMKGDAEEIVAEGAHTLFFPHGLGHMIGLDVHDMESLGEDYVGYGKNHTRSDQFGTKYLRLARELRPGFVVTIEPGIYFIPALIQQWKSRNKYSDMINYNLLDKYLKFGGIRIEDEFLITENGSQLIGEPVPK